MSDDGDRDLRESFARLREEERARTPAYGALTARRHHRPRRLHALALASLSAAAAAALAAVWLATERGRGTDPAVLAPQVMRSVRWEAPTDFLLRTSGGEMLRTVPSFGGTGGWGIMQTDAPRGRARPTPDTIRDQGRTS